MLQRIQTLYWLGALLINVWVGISLLSVQTKSFYSLMYFALSFDLLFIILLFKKRALQITLNSFAFYFETFCTGLLIFNFSKHIQLYIPSIIAVALILLAGKAVKKDEELVRSSDRLR